MKIRRTRRGWQKKVPQAGGRPPSPRERDGAFARAYLAQLAAAVERLRRGESP